MNSSRYWLALFLCCACLSLQAQPQTLTPGNDRCAGALPIKPGQFIIGLDNATASKGLEFETPAVAEATCIQSIENDMWFSFHTIEGQEWYEVRVIAENCNTPAGLQALLIRADDCNAAKFTYEGCSNKINTDTIKLFLHQPQAGVRYLIWVDGFDGTICEYSVALNARPPLSPADYRYLRFDYDLAPAPHYELDGYTGAFNNNEATIRWKAGALDNTATYVVEQLPELSSSPYARIVGFVDPQAMVGVGDAFYELTDRITPFQQGKRYNYRIVRVATDGSRSVSETFSITAKLSTSFFVAEVKADTEPATFIARYINYKKGQSFTLRVVDAQQKVVKEMKLTKEPARDGTITLKMADFPVGTYTFEMSNGKESFRRAFVRW